MDPDDLANFGPCARRGLAGSYGGLGVCYNLIDFDPRFVDLNGDGYLDLLALERENPGTLWVCTACSFVYAPLSETSPARTRAWIQDPNAAGGPRWVREPRFDLPVRNGWAHSWLEMWFVADPVDDDRPGTYNATTGVQFGDLNRDGLTDVVWKLFGGSSYPGALLDRGVLLNTGQGAAGAPASAWCASDAQIAPTIPVCAAAASASAYLPPDPGFAWEKVGYAGLWNHPTGYLTDLNGDAWLDYLRLDVPGFVEAWLRSHGGPAGLWQRDSRFDPFIPDDLDALGPTVQLHFAPLDLNGDGASDFVGGNLRARVSISHHPDLLREIRNGRGGTIRLAYEAAARQRNGAPDQPGTLEADAETDAAAHQETDLPDPLNRGSSCSTSRTSRGGPPIR